MVNLEERRGREDLGSVEGGENIVRICYVIKKNVFNKKEKEICSPFLARTMEAVPEKKRKVRVVPGTLKRKQRNFTE